MTADDLVTALEPWMTPDLETYLRAIGGMFAQVELYTDDDQDRDGWTILLDPDRCPVEALPYLAHYVGERLPVGITEAAAREWIKDAPNQRRGTARSIFQAAQRNLINGRLVAMFTRPGGNVDQVVVHTYTADTPDPVLTERDIRSMVPADIELVYSVSDGQIWASVDAAYDTWDDVSAAYDTWDDVRVDEAGAVTYSRPRP